MKINVQTILLILAEQCLSKAAFAERSGLPRQYISTILSRGRCTTVTVGKLARGLGVSVSEITEED